MNKYYAIAMLAALRANQTNIDELEKIRRLTKKHKIGYNDRQLCEAQVTAHAVNDTLFNAIRDATNNTTSTNSELFDSFTSIVNS